MQHLQHWAGKCCSECYTEEDGVKCLCEIYSETDEIVKALICDGRIALSEQRVSNYTNHRYNNAHRD